MSLQAKTAAKTSRLNIFHTTKRQVCACQGPRDEERGRNRDRARIERADGSGRWKDNNAAESSLCNEARSSAGYAWNALPVEHTRGGRVYGKWPKEWGWVRKTAVSRRQMSKYPARVKCLTFWLRPQQMRCTAEGEREERAGTDAARDLQP